MKEESRQIKEIKSKKIIDRKKKRIESTEKQEAIEIKENATIIK